MKLFSTINYRLQVFCEVALRQSISAAAKILCISQPAVTQHIKLLEESFSTTFFIRSRHGVILTQAGTALLAHVRQMRFLEETFIEKLREQGSVLQGRLSLGASVSILDYYLPSLLGRFKHDHPKVVIDIFRGNSSTIIGALLDQRIDIGLIEAPCRRRDLRVLPFCEDEIVVIASLKNPLAKKRFVTLPELAKASFIFREQGSGMRQYVEEHLQRANIKKVKIVQELPSIEAIKKSVALDMGLSFVSRMSVETEVSQGILAILNIPKLRMHRYFSTILSLGSDPIGVRQVFLSYLNREENTLDRLP